MVDPVQMQQTYQQLKSVGMDIAPPTGQDPASYAIYLNTAATAYNTLIQQIKQPTITTDPSNLYQKYGGPSMQPASNSDPSNLYQKYGGPSMKPAPENRPSFKPSDYTNPNFRPDPHTRPPNFNGPINPYNRPIPSASGDYSNYIIGKQLQDTLASQGVNVTTFAQYKNNMASKKL